MKAYEECSRFDKCAVNKCPLHTDYKDLSSMPGDSERKCTMARNNRLAIGSKYADLAYFGLTGHEYLGLKEAGKLPPNLANPGRNALSLGIQNKGGIS